MPRTHGVQKDVPPEKTGVPDEYHQFQLDVSETEDSNDSVGDSSDDSSMEEELVPKPVKKRVKIESRSDDDAPLVRSQLRKSPANMEKAQSEPTKVPHNIWKWMNLQQEIDFGDLNHSCPFGLSPHHPDYSSMNFGLTGGLRADFQAINSEAGFAYKPVYSRSQILCGVHPCLNSVMDERGMPLADRKPRKRIVQQQLQYFRRTYGSEAALDLDPDLLQQYVVEGLHTQITDFSNESTFQKEMNSQGNMLLQVPCEKLYAFPLGKFRSVLGLGSLDLQRAAFLQSHFEMPLKSTILQIIGAGSLVLSRCEHRLEAHQVARTADIALQPVDSLSFDDRLLWAAVNPYVPAEASAVLQGGSLEIWNLQDEGRPLDRQRKFGTLFPPLEESQAWSRLEYAWHPKVLLCARGQNLFEVDLRSSHMCRKETPLPGPICGMAVNSTYPFEFALSTASQVALMDARLSSRPVLSWNHYCETGPRQLQFLPNRELLAWTHHEQIRIFQATAHTTDARQGTTITVPRGAPIALSRQAPFISNVIGCLVLPSDIKTDDQIGPRNLMTLQADGSVNMTVFQSASSETPLPFTGFPVEEHSDESDADGPDISSSSRRGPIRTTRAVHASEIPKTNRTKYYVLDLTGVFRYMVRGYQEGGVFESIPVPHKTVFDEVEIRENILKVAKAEILGFIGAEARTLCDIVCFLAARLGLCHRLVTNNSGPSTRSRKENQAQVKLASKLFIPSFGQLAQVVATTLIDKPTEFHMYKVKRPRLMPAVERCRACVFPDGPLTPCGPQCELLRECVLAKSKPIVDYPKRTVVLAAEEKDLSQDTEALTRLLSQTVAEEETPTEPDDETEKTVDDLLADLGAMWKIWSGT